MIGAVTTCTGARVIDIPRKISHWPRRLRAAGLLLALLVALTAGYRQLTDHLQTTTLAIDEVVVSRVEQGTLVRDVRATGLLVPTELRWITARAEGQVERILIEAGTSVQADSVILELSNPALARDVDAARIALDAHEAQALVLEKRAINDLLAQEAQVAEYASRYENARFRLEANQALGDVVSRVDLHESTLLAAQLHDRLAIERRRLTHLEELQQAEVLASAAETARLQRQLQLQEELLAGLSVRAGIDGILQEVPVEPGQLLASGTPLARVARQDNFKTVLRVPEGQAKEVRAGQHVTVSAGGQAVPGKVTRIDPAVQDGTVQVDVAFLHAALPGARPDLRVQGIIEIARIDDTLVLARPVFSNENTTRELYVLSADAAEAHLQPVSLGLGSADRIQVLSGVGAGAAVIVSDMERYRPAERIVLRGGRP